ncbi:MAG: hypothetical protein HYV09_11060 [Deltaproteobacteria bacterium]|nr:hypothetical protein [Deltaproteobacteria bacterium]
MARINLPAFFLAVVSVSVAACGDDSSGSEAQRRGVGAACTSNADCVEAGQTCLGFKGGYCGVQGCSKAGDCPGGSACVAHTDGKNYCFLICNDKPQCNTFRPVDVEANCSSSVTFVDGTKGAKACVPPS